MKHQWLCLVPIKAARWHIFTPEGKDYKWYISGIYCQLGGLLCHLPPFLRKPGKFKRKHPLERTKLFNYIYFSAIYLRGPMSLHFYRSDQGKPFCTLVFANKSRHVFPCNLCLFCVVVFTLYHGSSPSTTICFLFPASYANPIWPWQAMMQRMQQKQKDAVATLAVEGDRWARGFLIFFPAWKTCFLSKQDVPKH